MNTKHYHVVVTPSDCEEDDYTSSNDWPLARAICKLLGISNYRDSEGRWFVFAAVNVVRIGHEWYWVATDDYHRSGRKDTFDFRDIEYIVQTRDSLTVKLTPVNE